MADDRQWTIGQLLEWTTTYLQQHGADSPRLDAEVLLATARGCSRIDLYTAWGAVADDELRTRFRDLVRQRAEGKPVAYLVGEREFYSLPFSVTPAVLIPRPETELVVLRVLDLSERWWPNQPVRIADLGTGSGAIAVSTAKHLSRATLVAIDASAEALAVARRNAERHGVADRIEFLLGDWFSAVDAQERFHLIASNPPYVSELEFADLPRDVRDHEPRLALVSADEGMAATQQIIRQAPDYLAPGGWVVLETSPQLAERVCCAFEQDPRYDSVDLQKDMARQPRVVSARLANTHP